MRELTVSVERDGRQVPVGSIHGDQPETARFSYSEEYLNSKAAAAISVSLPLQSEAFTPLRTKAFFEGMLPEGFTRRTVASRMHLDENDYLSILYGLGRECLGAIRISAGHEDMGSSYEELSTEQVRELAEEGAERSAELVTKAHLSLTGASGKVGLYYDEEHDRWYLPKGLATSTHIVKQSHVRLNYIVTNEQLSLMTAYRCGIQIPKSFIINTGNAGDGEVLLATQRYDRVYGDDTIDGLIKPLRLHQEDFCQAMGIAAAEKYERNLDGYMAGMFELLRKRSSDPISDQLKLWDMIVFDYLLGNTDAHIKNFSLLYGRDMRTLRLAPAYDLVSTTVYEASTRDMAFSIGGQYSVDEIDEESFRRAARAVNLGEKMAISRYKAMLERFEAALYSAAAELSDMGFDKAGAISKRIMQTGGINKAIRR